MPMTLGDLKDKGLMPSPTQIFFLEIEESKKCTAFGGNQPHRHHCWMQENGKVKKDPCWHVLALWRNLEDMFPGIDIEKD